MKRFLPLLLLSLELFTPSIVRSQEESIGLRLIEVRSEAEAAGIRAQVQSGASFEALAKSHSVHASASVGGYLGILQLTDLKPELQQALRGLAPGRISAVTPLDGEFALFQRLSMEEVNWVVSNDAGIQAFEQRRYDAAAQSFRQAVQYAEKLTTADYRIEESLHGLAETYRLQKKYNEAEPVYRRYLAAHWGGNSAPEVLDRCSALLAVTYFHDSPFDETLRKFQEAVNRSPMGEDLYQAISAILFKAQLIPVAEALMVRAAELFPASKDVHFHLAQLYLVSGKTMKALEAFEQLSRMKAPAGVDPAVDRLQQSVVYQKIGSIRAELADFEQAVSAYRKALEVTPDSSEARLGLGDVYLREGKPDDALAEYAPVAAAAPQSVPAQFRVADANLRRGSYPEAAAAAAKALAIDPKHQRARYIRATAFLRMDRKEEGDKELELYRKLEAETRAETDRNRNVVVLNRGAAGKFLEGKPEEAIEMFLKIIETYPDVSSQYLNLGMVQSKLGRHQAAIDTFQKMLSLGMDDGFLVYWNLSQEYRLLGDMDASRRHEVVYLQNLDVALGDALDWNLEQGSNAH
jgi:tetratricopeptide (TPR) repeat protein